MLQKIRVRKEEEIEKRGKKGKAKHGRKRMKRTGKGGVRGS